MKLFTILIMVLTAYPLNALSDEVIHLDKDQKAPYEGFLFDREKAEKVRILDIGLKSQVKINSILTDENGIYEERLTNLREQNSNLSKSLIEERSSSIWSKLGFFILGAAVTTGVVYGVSKATR